MPSDGKELAPLIGLGAGVLGLLLYLISGDDGVARLEAQAEAYKSGAEFDLLASGPHRAANLLQTHAAVEGGNERAVCVSGELVPRSGQAVLSCLQFQDDAAQMRSTVNALAAAPFRFDLVESRSQQATANTQDATVKRTYQGFSLGRLQTLPCSVSSPGAPRSLVDVEPECLDRQLNESAQRIKQHFSHDPGAPLPFSLLHEGFKTSNVIDVPRAQHSYSDYFAGRLKKVINLFVPVSIRCSIVGKLMLDGDRLTITAHPIVGFRIYFQGGRVSLAVLASESLRAAENLKSVLPFLQGLSTVCFFVAGGAGLVWLGSSFFGGGGDGGDRAGVAGVAGVAQAGGAQISNPPPQLADHEAANNERECVVCLSNASAVILLPCGHLCMCKTCANELLLLKVACPVCRARIVTVQPVYF